MKIKTAKVVKKIEEDHIPLKRKSLHTRVYIQLYKALPYLFTVWAH